MDFFGRSLVLVCLPDSILAFHKNGMQGRSLKNGEITQEICDMSRTYRLLGSDKYVKIAVILHIQFTGFPSSVLIFGIISLNSRVVALESQVMRTGTLTHEEGHDLHILAGHEASY